MKKFKLFLCGLMAIAFTACSNDDPSQEEVPEPIICELPDGTTFRDALVEAIGNGTIKSIKFEANSNRSTTNGTQIGSSTAYALVDGDCLYVYTTEDKFVFHQDCSKMFSAFMDGQYLGQVKEVQMIDFGNCIDTSNVTDMGEMFYSCSALGSLNLSNFDTSNVTDMGLMFSRCSSLGSLDLSNFDTSNVTDMSFMFSDCSSLGSLDLCSFTFNAIISEMFKECRSLTHVFVKNTSDRDRLLYTIPNGTDCIISHNHQ